MKLDLKPFTPNLGRIAEGAAETERKLRGLTDRPARELAAVPERAERAAEHLGREVDSLRRGDLGYRSALPTTAGGVAEALLSAEARGTSIGMDDGRHPYRFGYGEQKPTLAEVSVGSFGERKVLRDVTGRDIGTTTDELGARARLFGGASAETLSASLGVEGELGARHVEDRRGPRYRDGLDRSRHSETFAGIRTRNFVEGGPLGGTAGSETFVGVDHYERAGNRQGARDWDLQEAQVSLGVRQRARVHAGIDGASVDGTLEAGLRGRYQHQQHFNVSGPIGALNTVAVTGFAGAREEISASVSPVGGAAHLEVFAGVRAGVEERLALAYQGEEVAGGRVGLEGWAGVGLRADAKVGLDLERGELNARGGAGAALGLGAGVEGELTLGGAGVVGAAQDTAAPALIPLFALGPRRV